MTEERHPLHRVPTGMNHTVLFLLVTLVLSACAGDAPETAANAAAGTAAPAPPAAVADSTNAVADSALAVVPGGELKPAAGASTPHSGSAAPTPRSPAAQSGTGGTAAAAPTPAQPAGAQDDGAAVLRRAAAAYENVRSLRADFVMQLDNPLLKQQLTSRGTLYQRRPDRIAVRFSDPAGDILLSDGEFFYMYYPSINPQQVIRCAAAAGAAGGVDLQAQFIGDPVERFRFTLHGIESVDGRPAHVITMVPRQAPEYRSLKVWLDTRDSLARRFEITEHNGTVRRFDLAAMVVNAVIPDATFRFTPPEGARVVSTC